MRRLSASRTDFMPRVSPWARLKTGTPARLDGDTIAWDRLEMQDADKIPTPFSFLTDDIINRQVQCGVTWTTEETHAIIAAPARRERSLRRPGLGARATLLPLHRGQGGAFP